MHRKIALTQNKPRFSTPTLIVCAAPDLVTDLTYYCSRRVRIALGFVAAGHQRSLGLYIAGLELLSKTLLP